MALWIAAEEVPDVDLDAAREAIALLGSRAPSVDGALRNRIERLNRYFFEELGFAGNAQDYYDPRNSYLHEVVARRTGIPITLAILYMSIAEQMGLRSHGVGFPGHFLVGFEDEREDLFVDPFRGSILSASDCEALLRGMFGSAAQLEPAHLAPATPAQILLRMLSNLKQIFAGAENWNRAIACSDRALALFPDSAIEHRDRGLFHMRAECFRPAADDLERYLALSPHGSDRAAVEELLAVARERAGRLN
jgi:regulator of sirC expression with transglutaminase-like and TPR domain